MPLRQSEFLMDLAEFICTEHTYYCITLKVILFVHPTKDTGQDGSLQEGFEV